MVARNHDRREWQAIAAASSAVAAAVFGDNSAAFTAGSHAINVSNHSAEVRRAQRADFDALLNRKLGKPGNLGRRIDPPEKGPLGDLWYGQPPNWYIDLRADYESINDKQSLPEYRGEAPVEDLQSKLKELEANRRSLESRISVLLQEKEVRDFEVEQLELELARIRSYTERLTGRTLVDRFWTLQSLMLAIAICFMVTAVVVTLLAICEIQSRQDFVRVLSTRAEETQRELIAHGGALPSGEDSRSNDWETLALLHELKADAQLLISTGANGNNRTLVAMREQLAGSEETTGDMHTRTLSRFAGFVSCLVNALASWIPYQTSDLLLSIVVILAGMIGSVIAATRTDKIFTGKELMLGLSAGLITFLAIRSGRSVMLLQIDGATYMLNPYTSAFLGLAAGLFTERAFKLLLSVVLTIIDKLIIAFNLEQNLQREHFGADRPAFDSSRVRSEETIHNDSQRP